MKFPETFTWGVSAAAPQVEGAAFDDGRGKSVWDVFAQKEGAIWNGHTPTMACDHYHRYKEDVALMKELKIQAYRLSLSWSRLIPDGTGQVNTKGVDFYNRLIDELLDANITPWVTLFHWDYPFELFCRGGWLNNESSEWFAEYTQLVVKTLSDRVKHWFTFNEIEDTIVSGHQTGEHAPGIKLSFAEVLRTSHNINIAHGKSVQAIRAFAKTKPLVGFAPCGKTYFPETDSPDDWEATKELTFSVTKKYCFNLAWWLDPVFFGKYPENAMNEYGKDMPEIKENDMEIISQPLDFCGINFYSARCARAGIDGPEIIPDPPGYPMTTQAGWRITPQGMYSITRLLYERYEKPIVVAENGHQNNDYIMADGKVHDPQRIDYISQYLQAIGQAIEDGCDVWGYFLWTFMDNFEWAFGYGIRVGLVHVDFQTLKRTPKDSAYWYKEVIESNGNSLLDETSDSK
jgi:beta-glucosidase